MAKYQLNDYDNSDMNNKFTKQIDNLLVKFRGLFFE